MTKLKINFDGLEREFHADYDERYYSSDSIEFGRSTKRFFYNVTNSLFEKAFQTSLAYKKIFNEQFLPLMGNELTNYAHFANAISSLTPIYMSEVPLNKSDAYRVESNRSVDFWCLHGDGDHSKKLNYFIELKKSYFCTSEDTKQTITSKFKATMGNLVEQLQTIKNAETGWDGDGNVFLGIIIVHGYHNSEKQSIDDSNKKMLDGIYENLDKRTNAQLLANTIFLSNKEAKELASEELYTFEKGDVCEFISFVGIALTTKK